MTASLTYVKFLPRPGFESRMLGGQFQGSNDMATWYCLALINQVPSPNQWITLFASNASPFRYFRYLSPVNSYGDIAELEFWSETTKLTGKPFGTLGSFQNSGSVFTHAFDGNPNTFVDTPNPSYNYLGIDLGYKVNPRPEPVVLPPAPIVSPGPVKPLSKYIGAPCNLSCIPQWNSSGDQRLSWTRDINAVTHNCFVNGKLIKTGIVESTYTLSHTELWGSGGWTGAMIWITSVDTSGNESIASQALPASYYGNTSVTSIPSPTVLDPISQFKLTSDWNQNSPRIVGEWKGSGAECGYVVSKNGSPWLLGLWGTRFLDADVQPGVSYTYTVQSMITLCTPINYGPISAPLSATALTAVPAPLTGQVTPVSSLQRRSSIVIEVPTVSGIVDWRLRDINDNTFVKYGGKITYRANGMNQLDPRMPYSIEWNGLGPIPTTLILEGVDKLGPMQLMESMNCDCPVGEPCTCLSYVNGQGDPSNKPNVLVTSAPFNVMASIVDIPGKQLFVENWEDVKPFTKLPMPTVIPPNSQYYGDAHDYASFENDRWQIRQYGCNNHDTTFKVDRKHFMPIVYDGGGPESPNPPHNNVASFVMMPKHILDTTGNLTAHWSIEVDAHLIGRAWIELGYGDSSGELINIAKFQDHKMNPLTQGAYLRWQIQEPVNSLDYFPNINGAFSWINLVPTDWNAAYVLARKSWDHTNPRSNGTTQDLDKKHTFHFYVNDTQIRLVEETPSGMYNVKFTTTVPDGMNLNKKQPYLVFQYYHSANSIAELKNYNPEEDYNINCRPYSFAWHIGQVRLEVLDTFPV